MIDNYDSFTYHLVQYFQELGTEVEVYRNDVITIEEIEAKHPRRIVVSPGPGTPTEAGISVETIRHFSGRIPSLGVCLGHQAIGEAFGGKIIRASKLMHGKISAIHHDGTGIFRGLSNPFDATRYHSLVIERKSMPSCLRTTAWTADHEIMAVEHREQALWGVQFHPESILTLEGKKLLKNFLEMT
jgi:anthranilate synthase component 2